MTSGKSGQKEGSQIFLRRTRDMRYDMCVRKREEKMLSQGKVLLLRTLLSFL